MGVVSCGTTMLDQGVFENLPVVTWDTTPKTSTFTAANGVGYFANTSGSAFTSNLPAGSAGAVVSFADYTRTFSTNSLTISPNGSEKIGGVAADLVLNVSGQSITLVYVDGTEGWINTNESTGQSGLLPSYIVATSPSVATVGDYKIHTFTGPGTFTVCSTGNPLGSDTVDYLVVAGGGGGAGSHGGAAGAGGYRESVPSPAAWTASPIANSAGAIPVSAQAYPITVGSGGPGQNTTSNPSGKGSNSTALGITSTGGGSIGKYSAPDGVTAGFRDGGSGAGSNAPRIAGLGNTPPVSPAQGFPGIAGANLTPHYTGGGGGGATATSPGAGASTTASIGGAGATSSINNSAVARAGGGGGGIHNSSPGNAGAGGTGGGGVGGGNSGFLPAMNGTVNTGGGGGGGGAPAPNEAGGSGGSGIVILRYKYQN
jgi:hypothetical protein|tara:strand:+ start:1139 stop:2422 length:1284 start_codon:yes stop_codon:yes gene_type:complete